MMEISYAELNCPRCRHPVHAVHNEVKMELTCPFCGCVLLKYKEGSENGQSIGGAK